MYHQAVLAKAGPTHHRFIVVCAPSPLERSLVSGWNCIKHLPGLLLPFYQMPGSSLSVPIPPPLPLPATRRTGFLEKFHFFGIHCFDSLTAPMSLLQEHRTTVQSPQQGLGKRRILRGPMQSSGRETALGDRQGKPCSMRLRLNNGII